MDKKKIAVVGATGFTGSELVRLLLQHPGVRLEAVTSESRAGQRLAGVHPFFGGLTDLVLEPADAIGGHAPDLVFLALPHGVSMKFVKRHAGAPFRMIDLSGDFRLGSADAYAHWYGQPHEHHPGLAEAVYGLPELNAERIRGASLVANPGCYPTATILALAPLVHAGWIDAGTVVVDAKSGVTGAGAVPGPGNLFSHVNENFSAYALKRHRHTPEIEEALGGLAGSPCPVLFTPHLLPVDRGILITAYARPSRTVDEGAARNLYERFYANAPFVRLRHGAPSLKDVRGTNTCDVCVSFDDRTGHFIILSAIDNLVKGAAGQAIQNMNLLFGWDQATGLPRVPFSP